MKIDRNDWRNSAEMRTDALAARIINELGVALKQFGTYAFDDKGPHEVMGFEMTAELRKLPAAEAAAVLTMVATSKKYKGRGLQVASCIVCDLQDWDELFEQPGIDNLLDGELPA